MKSIVVERFGGPEVLTLTETDMPTVGADDILIQVTKTSVNFADIKKRKGTKGKSVPFVPGLDVTGEVVSIGDNVSSIRVRQRVIAFPPDGSYAEYVVAPEALTFVVPDNVDDTAAAACPTVSILAFKLLHDVARIEEGETVLVHAAGGGVGTTAIQLAKLSGAGKVIGTVSSEHKFAIVKEAGADQVVVYDDFPEKVNDMTGGKGVDIVLDSLAGEITQRSMSCLAKFGKLVQFGNASGEIGNIQTKELHASCRSVLGFSLGTTRKERPHLLKEPAEAVLDYIAKGQLMIKVSEQFDLQDAKEAHAFVESRASTGKVLLNVK